MSTNSIKEIPNNDSKRPPRSDLLTMARKVGITEEEMREWLNAGKKAQQEVIDKLRADPEWRAMAKRFGVKLNAE